MVSILPKNVVEKTLQLLNVLELLLHSDFKVGEFDVDLGDTR